MDALAINFVGALARGLADLQREAMCESDLDASDLDALLSIFARSGGTVADVATTTGLTHSGAVRAVQRLMELGLVERRVGRDRRRAALHTLSAGGELARTALSKRKAALKSVLAALGPQEQTALARIAKKLLHHLPEDRAGAWRICRSCDHRVCRGGACPVGSAVS